MRTRDFHYELPERLIAQHPPARRRASRLLSLDAGAGALADRRFAELPNLLAGGDLLMLNDTRVRPARLFGRKASGGRVEVLIERVLGAQRALALVRASKPTRPGTRLRLADAVDAEVGARRGEHVELEFLGDATVLAVLEAYGHVPLPPYIRRADEYCDRDRYQTVYARHAGAVAAPTAGLHFDEDMLSELRARGIEQAFVTLHVGAGTFAPLRVEDPQAHRLHAEHAEVSASVCEALARCRRRGGRVVAVGTTTVRALEAAAGDGELKPFYGDTELFIRPGFRFRIVDALLTNFHLPGSTLLMLVCAFGGYAHVMRAYDHAVAEGYRFYSYGDAMLIMSGARTAPPRA